MAKDPPHFLSFLTPNAAGHGALQVAEWAVCKRLGARLGGCQLGVESLFRQLILSGLGPGRASGEGPQSQTSSRALAGQGPWRGSPLHHPHCQLAPGEGEGTCG